ncbi:MAG TPA: hypothetical protein VGC72_15765 [Candidatus Elarobacter sp.]|jgi:uncharacterized membrane protein YidH (DUF202 family)
MNCMDGTPGSELVATIGFFVVTAGLVLALLGTIFWIRKRWTAREAAGFVAVAYWWEAIVHALAVCAVIGVGLVLALGFLTRNGL